MITLVVNGQHTPVEPVVLWLSVAFSIAVVLTFYILRSIAIYTMAKKKKLKRACLAFIPCVWVYTACKLVGNSRFFGTTYDKLALVFCLIFSFGEILGVCYSFLNVFPIVGNFLTGKELFIVYVTDPSVDINSYTQGMIQIGSNVYGYNVVDPYANMGIAPVVMNAILVVFSYTVNLFDIAVTVISILLYINIFRRYVPQHYILFTVLSIVLGIFAPFVFAIRNRESIDYSEYLRSRYNAWYANANPYGGQANPYGGQASQSSQQTPPNPFSEFAGKDEVDPGDPFDNFNGKPKEQPKPKSDDVSDDEFDD